MTEGAGRVAEGFRRAGGAARAVELLDGLLAPVSRPGVAA